MTCEELENEIFISVIRDLLFFLFVNRARDPPFQLLKIWPSKWDLLKEEILGTQPWEQQQNNRFFFSDFFFI